MLQEVIREWVDLTCSFQGWMQTATGQLPVDLAYPINTYADEINLVVNAKGDVAYISSDKLGGKGGMDIYSFKLYKEAQPVMVTYFKGTVFDKETKHRLEAKFELIDLATGKIVSSSSSDPLTGEFLLALPTEKNYGLNVSKAGYLFYSDHFELVGESSKTKPFLYNVPLATYPCWRNCDPEKHLL